MTATMLPASLLCTHQLGPSNANDLLREYIRRQAPKVTALLPLYAELPALVAQAREGQLGHCGAPSYSAAQLAQVPPLFEAGAFDAAQAEALSALRVRYREDAVHLARQTWQGEHTYSLTDILERFEPVAYLEEWEEELG